MINLLRNLHYVQLQNKLVLDEFSLILMLDKKFLALIYIGFSSVLLGCSSEVKQDAIPALFPTKAAAEKAAKDFNCIGAHKMGDKWMPCKSHKMHQKQNSNNDSRHHHNH